MLENIGCTTIKLLNCFVNSGFMVVRVLGITGTFQAGKDAVAALIGWRKYSCSDIIREECLRRGLSIDNNQNLIDIGDEMRKTSGDAGVLGKKAVEQIVADGVDKAIVVSIRTPAEVLALKNAPNVDFRLLILDAPITLRFERAKKTPRFATIPFGEFKAQEEKQMQGGEAHNMHLAKVFEMADAKIVNAFETKNELKKAVDVLLNQWGWN